MAEDRVRASIFISLGITLSKFDPKDVRRFMEKSDFRLDEIGKKKMIVYCILPVADATWEPLISTFFSQMFQRLYDVADKNFNRLPVKVNLLLDEFPNLGKIPGYEEILATCRSYGISASTIVQSLGQLIDKYSKEKAESIIGNCSLRYLLGVGDKLTAEYFSELIGKTTIQTVSSSTSKSDKGGSDSTSQSYQGRNLLTPDELTRLPRDEAILLVSGMFGIRLQKAYQFEFFRGILNDQNKTSRFDYLKLKEQIDQRKTEFIHEEVKTKVDVKEGIAKNAEEITLEDMIDETMSSYKPEPVAQSILQSLEDLNMKISRIDENLKGIHFELEDAERRFEEVDQDLQTDFRSH
jgi:type IV secretion system protein VirD4